MEYGELGVFRSTGALLELEADNLVIEDSTVVANQVRALWLDGSTTRETVRNVIVVHRYSSRVNGDFQSLVRGSHLQNVQFMEDFEVPPDPGTIQGWYIATEPTVTYSNLCVDGPWIRWSHPFSGPTGCPLP